MITILDAEKHNELLLKNREKCPVDAQAFPEVNANYNENYGHWCGHANHGHNCGYCSRHENNYGNDYGNGREYRHG